MSNTITAKVLRVNFTRDESQGKRIPINQMSKKKEGYLEVGLLDGKKVCFRGERFISLFQLRSKHGYQGNEMWKALEETSPKEISLRPILIDPFWKIEPKEIGPWIERAKELIRATRSKK